MTRSKYGAVKTEIDGIVFDSKREADRYAQLCLLEKSGKVKQLELQPKFQLLVKTGKSVGIYKADFRYWDTDQGEWVVEDVKGVRTSIYRLKKKIVEEVHGIRIVEV
jgi:hypothetical protein